jgi:hypothetical protein
MSPRRRSDCTRDRPRRANTSDPPGVAESRTACAGRLSFEETALSVRREVWNYAPILNIFVPQDGQMPWVAGRPFFMVIATGSFISFLALHFTQ